MAMVNSTIVDEDDVSEKVVKKLVEQLGELPMDFTMELVLTVVITADDNKSYRKFARDLWNCAG